MPAKTRNSTRTTLSSEPLDELFRTLRARFEQHVRRHPGLKWDVVQDRLRAASSARLWSLSEMERTGGEPDVVGHDSKTGECTFSDCSNESPSGRRSVCY